MREHVCRVDFLACGDSRPNRGVAYKYTFADECASVCVGCTGGRIACHGRGRGSGPMGGLRERGSPGPMRTATWNCTQGEGGLRERKGEGGLRERGSPVHSTP